MRNIGDPLSPDLLGLHSVAAARVGDDGSLIESSAGFRTLYPPATGSESKPYVAAAFIRPDFRELLEYPINPDQPAYRGLMTLGEYDGISRSLQGTVTRHPDGITLVAEYDVDEFERLYVASIEQNRELAELQRELAAANRRYQKISVTDPLTGVANRRRMDEYLEAEINRAKRQGSKLSIAMCDIDHFKKYNDNYGHETGDRFLVRFAELLRDQFRTTDLVTRYGGEEFVILLPQTEIRDAAGSAERVRKRLEHTVIDDTPERITASFGIVEWLPGESASRVLKRADAALYEAKKKGRNLVWWNPDEGGSTTLIE